MRLDVSKLPYTKEYKIVEEVNFDDDSFVCRIPLIKINSCVVEAKAQRFEEFIYVTLSLKANVTLQCSYTLEHFDTVIKGNDELHFAPNKDEDEDCIEYKGNSIDLDEYIFNLLSASIPLSPKSPNAKAPSSGKGYRVISDEEYQKEKEESGNSQFDVLKDLEFDE